MKKQNLIRTLVGVGMVMLSVSNALAGIVIIGNSKRTERLDDKEAKTLYQGDKSSLGSGPVKLFDQPEGSKIRDEFYQKLLGKDPQAAKAMWAEKTFTGAAKAPVVKSSDKEVMDKIVEEPAAIGYVDSESVKGNASVKVLYTVK
jgi:hypothetical protein